MTDLTPKTDIHAQALMMETHWLGEVITARLQHFFADSQDAFAFPSAPSLPKGAALTNLIAEAGLDTAGRLVLALALAPQINPATLDPFFVRNTAIDRVFSEFGAVRVDTASFVPTAVTALFLLGGGDTDKRISAMQMFAPDHPLRQKIGLTVGQIIDQTQAQTGNLLSGPLSLPPHRVIALCAGTPPAPDFSPQFPAKRLSTRLEWDDLILPREIKHNINHMIGWLENQKTILDDWGLSGRLSSGFKSLFYGPPGTGKTLTATLLGKRTGLQVYRIDLAMIVSKYIGETEKNLSHVFDLAQERDWILFFDEADALFGARTATSSSNDRHANQEVSYLLQRIEDCTSLVILATNLRSNIDEAFFRRFQMAIGFTKPDATLRKQLWDNMLSDVPLAGDADTAAIATEFDLTGGAITNVVRHAAITALRRGSAQVSGQDLRKAIADELRKEGRTV
ncbi:ATP-binding protein [Yoonia sediminilitoris]|uniref:ATPase family protein associated with various cellular activities (AAA) n=1 Tax=Yoonia sediminilitoris TaxID=1286148 RepID=A0A2T6KMF3_9RHOB|nr:ATP-binding protein [Yoonia sediminilitoris]PUB17390.1 ATPase family protein associated with various cellular activities (AAA) [Yoonia sediminilitoris]RCW97685.1 ATPase family protein associated with various cellular activities (AAA) [Yoonia sediminilitoris]